MEFSGLGSKAFAFRVPQSRSGLPRGNWAASGGTAGCHNEGAAIGISRLGLRVHRVPLQAPVRIIHGRVSACKPVLVDYAELCALAIPVPKRRAVSDSRGAGTGGPSSQKVLGTSPITPRPEESISC